MHNSSSCGHNGLGKRVTPMSYEFRTWRRRSGVVILGLACIIAFGWVRSFFACDLVGFTGNGLTDAIRSYQGKICTILMTSDLMTSEQKAAKSTFLFKSINASDFKGGDDLPPLTWQFLGMARREMSEGGIRFSVFEISYWLILLPLTSISAFLLLSKQTQHAS